MKKRLTVWKRVIIILLTMLIALVSFSTILYRDMLFRDYENFDLAGSDGAISILFVGNSQIFWGRVPKQLYTISRMYGIDVTYKDISSNGAHLSRSQDAAIAELQSGKYDFVVLQDNTRLLPGNIDDFFNVIRILCNEARANGTVPVLYNPVVANDNRQPDTNRIAIFYEAYKRAADENDAILVNAGAAWICAYQDISEISLFAWDGMHANNAGGFLTACVFAATLFDLRIEEIPKNSIYKGSNAIKLAQIAWDFVQSSEDR